MRRRSKANSTGAIEAPDRKDAGLAAIKLLSRRDFATAELAARLETDGYLAEAVAAVLAELTADRILDDSRFAAHYVAYHSERGRGPRRIAMELGNRGVAQSHIEAALTTGPDWADRARAVRIQRFGLPLPESWAEKAKQGRFLQYRGFSSDHIRSALGPDFESEDPT